MNPLDHSQLPPSDVALLDQYARARLRVDGEPVEDRSGLFMARPPVGTDEESMAQAHMRQFPGHDEE